MLDQKKTGQFILEMRKEKGLTQKQLADLIGVGDKAVSRWETGRGMPDTSIMPELCKTLSINVNELLAGERLSTDTYSGKAEEHMVELIRNSEQEKKSSRSAAIGTIVGIVLFLLFLWVIVIPMSGGIGMLWLFVDLPSLVAIVGIQGIILGAGGQFANFLMGCKLVFRKKKDDAELPELARKAEYAMGYGIKALLLGGVLVAVLGLLFILTNIVEPAQLGPTLAVDILTVFYSLLLTAVLLVIKARLHAMY